MNNLTIPDFNDTIRPSNEIVFCSSAVGPLQEKLFELMEPTVKLYTKLHKMDYYLKVFPTPLDSTRPAPWGKIIIIKKLLNFYKTVIWIDSDALIYNPTIDIRGDINTNYPMQLVTHNNINPIFPNTGVWVVQKDSRSNDLLDAIWQQTHTINSAWWEQHALIELIGYRNPFLGEPKYEGTTKYSDWVGTLDLKWNSRHGDSSENPVIFHFPGFPYEQRLELMQKYFDEFKQKYLNQG
ncbi:hypothetical protein ACQKNS_02160 [Peribacillus sp. NPDC094092]|uniref:hypothetical protein n=1 Tax=Peribacillus sp. NPDC094092 TaxID=3390611 RepID=UPI003D000DF3